MPRRSVLAVVVVLAVLAVGGVGFALFERHERGGLVAKSERACGGLDEPEDGVPASLPLGLPLPSGGTILEVTEQGSTSVAFVSVEGGREDLVDVRDDVLADLKAVGYETVGTDQEPGYEAEAEVGGVHEGTVKVSPLCEGLIQVRYAVSS